ncbi:hypothetical protein EDC01DRAFT_750448 [Geopyxis carbonaria]|nr:hypothetical protein EDC01DRAFT_750448 [Geopyxis carbonaria]
MHESAASITPASLASSSSATEDPTPASTGTTTPATPQRAINLKDPPTSRAQSSQSYSSGAHTPDGSSHIPTPPLTVEKVTSGRSTPTPGIVGKERAVVLTGNTVEERATNYIQSLRSPVVEDTLSDIEEAISEISKSSQSRRASKVIHDHNRRYSAMSPAASASVNYLPATQEMNDSGSEYSVQEPSLQDFSSDIEDDEEPELPIQGYAEYDDILYTKADILAWSPADVSQYLQSRHIPLVTCSKFEEQEVSGAILLQLEMSHLKELELGSFGKRFEVWKEIEHLIKNLKHSTKPRSGSDAAARLSTVSFTLNTDNYRQRSSTVGAVLPRIRSQHNRPISRQHEIDVQEANMHHPTTETENLSPPISSNSIGSSTYGVFEQPRSPPLSPSGRKASASKRHSTHDHTSPATALNAALSASVAVLSAGGVEQKAHQRENSFDRNWSNTLITGPPRPSTATGMREAKGKHRATPSTGTGDTSFTGDSGFSGSQPPTPNERSYFSSGESAPRERKVLQKKSGTNHSRKGSYTEEQRLRSATAHTRHSRIASAESAIKRNTPSLSAAIAYHKSKDKHKRISASLGEIDVVKMTPPSSSRGNGAQPTDESIHRRTTSPPNAAFGGGLAIESFISNSDEKLDSPASIGAQSLGSAEGSTPSGTVSIDVDATPDRPSKADRINSGTSMKKRIRGVSSGSGLRQKSKRQTTALEKGIKEITPEEAAKDADFSGWMKKRGSTGVGTWKARFFVLSGRRLSYFYSSTDTKERGLIDITSHKVLACTEDRLIGLHAAIAAATSPAPSPKPAPSPLFQKKEKAKEEKEEKDKGWFTFKLIPPAPGAAKGVTFTPPRLHYFATDTREEGKKWMAAMMKATIDRDETKPVVTSYNAKTISLAKARELRTRPPALKKDTEIQGEEVSGLAICGLELGVAEGDEADDEDGRHHLDSKNTVQMDSGSVNAAEGDIASKQPISESKRHESDVSRSDKCHTPDSNVENGAKEDSQITLTAAESPEDLKTNGEGILQIKAVGVVG